MKARSLISLFELSICVLAIENNPSCTAATATISSQSEASALASQCPTLSGSLALATGISGDISLDGIEVIEGDLLCEQLPNLTSLSANTLKSIQGGLSLSSLSSLTKFTPASTFGASRVLISGTALTSFTYTNVGAVGSFDLTGNTALDSVSLSFANADSINVADNGDDLTVYFPQLLSAGNASFSGCTLVLFPDLVTIEGSLSLTDNDKLVSFEIEKLTSVGGDLIISNNPDLTQVLATSITRIDGAIQTSNNPKLPATDLFPALKQVEAAADILSAAPSTTTTAVETSTTSTVASTSSTSTAINVGSTFSRPFVSSQFSASSRTSTQESSASSTPLAVSLINSASISTTIAFSTSVATSGGTAKATTAITSSSTAGATESPGGGASGSSLSIDAKIGIGIGSAVGLALFIGLSVIVYHCSARQRHSFSNPIHELPGDNYPRYSAQSPTQPPRVQTSLARRSVTVIPTPTAGAHEVEIGELIVSNVQLRDSRPQHPLKIAAPFHEKAQIAAREREQELRERIAELPASDVARVSRIHELYGSEEFQNPSALSRD